MPFPTEFIEKVDNRAAHYLLSILTAETLEIHQDEDAERQIKLANAKKILHALTVNHGVKKSIYKKSAWDRDSCLRWYVQCGIQQLPSAFRGLLCKGMTDIDIVNAHPAIIHALCQKYDIPHLYLTEYIEHRDDLIARKQTTKVAVLKSLNKGYKMKGTTWFNQLDAEFKSIQRSLIPHYPALWEMAKAKDKSNHEGRFMSYVCQFWENQILEHVVSICPYTVSVLMFDGFMIEGDVPYSYLDELSRTVLEQFDMKIKWAFKAHNDCLSVPDDFEFEEMVKFEDDATAAKYVLDVLEGHLYEWEGLLYYKQDNKWITDKHTIDKILCDFIMSLNIRKLDGKPYSSNVSGTKHIYEALRMKIPTKNMRPLLHSSTKYKLCFRNGVLDLRHGTLTSWDDCDDVETCIVLDHDYVPHDTTELKRRIFATMYGEDMDMILISLSRAMAGCIQDKSWFYYLGSRNCGKSALFNLFENAFGEYIQSWKVQNIMYHGKKGPDNNEISRKLYWLLDHEYARLSISQEVPKPEMNLKINGSFLKCMTGGGDSMVARRNFDTHDQHFVMDTTFLIFGNNGLECDCADAFETCIEVSTAFEYVHSQSQIDAVPENQRHKYRLGDPDLKDIWVKQKDTMNACISLMVEYYRPTKFVVIRDMDTVEEVKLIHELMGAYQVNLTDAIYVVLGANVFEKFKDKKKVKAELLSMGVEYRMMRTATHRYNGKMCFFGIMNRGDEI